MAMLLEKVLVIMDKLMVIIMIKKVLVVFGKAVGGRTCHVNSNRHGRSACRGDTLTKK